MTTETATTEWMAFTPSFAQRGKPRLLWRAAMRELLGLKAKEAVTDMETRLKRLLQHSREWPAQIRPGLRAALSLTTDLCHQGWMFEIRRDGIFGRQLDEPNLEATRDVRRRQLALRREEQLRHPATRAFVTRMERRQSTAIGRHSIFDLMCDGPLLAQRVAQVLAGSTTPLVKPYLQLAEPGATCAQTGLALQDVWRYFRHTWTNAYESTPGRSIQLLVRDGSQPLHPVMGLLALGSAAIKVRCRDSYIGWEPDDVLAAAQSDKFKQLAQWVVQFLQAKFDEIYKVDLLEDNLMPAGGLRVCTLDDAKSLFGESTRSRNIHQANIDRDEFARAPQAHGPKEIDWESHARTKLFRSKRCRRLSELIEAAVSLGYMELDGVAEKIAVRIAESKAAHQAVERMVVFARSETVGTEIADLTVCGSIPPYNEILGGKLVAMLAVSADIVRLYRNRYKGSPSIIASSMAGCSVVRPANLVFVGTTSLYGVRPSQYDRISYPTHSMGGKPNTSVAYRFLDLTEGFGSSQISDRTAEALDGFLAQTAGRTARANNVFGEGANPRMRALRETIDELGFSAENVLRHGQRKCVYGVHLARNTRDYLLRFHQTPDYLFDVHSASSSALIAAHWQRRWAIPRLSRHETLARISGHSTVLPVRHGARINTPEDESGQLFLFDARGN